MPFTDIEKSDFDSHVIELYQFKRASFSWRYTSADEDVLHNGQTYIASPMVRGKLESTSDLGKNNLKITMSRRAAFGVQFIESSPTDVISVTLIRIHEGLAEEAVTWKGRVVNVSFASEEVEITCQSNMTSLKRSGLRRPYQLVCPHVLYGPKCTVASSANFILATLTAIVGNVLTAPELVVSINASFDATWFIGGYIEFTENSLTTRRFITNHDNVLGSITLNLPISSLIVGGQVKAFAGCDHATGTCSNKFANILNYGGFPYIPQKNPMDGTPIF